MRVKLVKLRRPRQTPCALNWQPTKPRRTAAAVALTRRNAAADAQVAADTAQSDLDAHEASTHNTDATARS